MQYRLISLFALLVCFLALCGCQSLQDVQPQPVDVASSELFHDTMRNLSVSRGPLVEGAVGSEIDQFMDRGDHDNMVAAIIDQPLHQTAAWTNLRRHIHYQVTPTLVDWSGQGYYCRQYQVTVIMPGAVKRGEGRLCRVRKNSWQIIPLQMYNLVG